MNEVEVKRKLYEEYVQHINKIKLEHKAQLEKGNIFFNSESLLLWTFSVEQIYKEKLMLMGESQGRELNILDMNVTDEAYESISQFGNQFPHDLCRDLNDPELSFQVSRTLGKNLEQEGIKIRPFQYIERKRNSAIIAQEMSRLQLDIEMKTGKVNNLREQLILATEELEQAEIAKEKLKSMTTEDKPWINYVIFPT